jgi:hypothetical protein
MSTDHHTGDAAALSILLRAVESLTTKIDAQSEQIIALTARVADLQAKVAPARVESPSERRTRREMEAIALINVIGPNVRAIARKMEMSEGGLRKMKTFLKAIDLAIGSNQARRESDHEDDEMFGVE